MSLLSCSTFVAVVAFIMPVVQGENMTGAAKTMMGSDLKPALGKNGTGAVSATKGPDLKPAVSKNGTGAVKATEGPDLKPEGACKAALDRLCAHVIPGSGRKAHCLRQQTIAAANRKEAPPLTPACSLQMQTFFIRSAQSGILKEPVWGFKVACKIDIEKHCAGRPTIVPCLKEAGKKNLIRKACYEKLLEVRLFESEDMRLDVVLMKACKGDLQQVPACSGDQLQTPGARKACLKAHVSNLTAACRSALFSRAQEDARDVRLNQDLFRACSSEIDRACGSHRHGQARKIKCLWENKEAPWYSAECKRKVVQATREKISDYRLDFRVRHNCQDDIKKLCAQEKENVDSLPVEELFATGAAEGRSGLVLHCLKKNYQRLTKTPCKQEIQHVVRVHTLDPTSDPVFRRRCSKDMSRHCVNVAPEMTHFCLRNHIANLTKDCRQAEVIQGKLASGDITMRPKMSFLCKQEIQTLCSMPSGHGQVIACLQDRALESSIRGSRFSEQCKEIVQMDIVASNHDWQLKFGLHKACNVDAGRLCGEHLLMSSSQVLPCLKANADNIGDVECKRQVNRVIRQGAANIRAAPSVYAACINDVQAHCSEVSPGQGRVRQCLLNHRNSLSLGCAQDQFKLQQQIAGDARRHPRARIVCANAWKKLCSNVVFGNGAMWHCMQSKKDSPEMSSACWNIVTSQERLQNFEFFLNPQLSKPCKSEAIKLCPFEATMAERSDFNSNGNVITCLIQSRTRISNAECSGALLSAEKQRIDSIRNNPKAITACAEDQKQHCPNVGRSGHGELWNCLRKHIKKISALACRKIVIDLMRLETEDYTLMSGLQKHCAAARQRFCQREPDHTGRVVMCMMNHMHSPDMEPGCQAKLVEKQGMFASSLQFNPLVAKSCTGEVERLYGKTKDANCQPHDEVMNGLSGMGLHCLTSHYKQLQRGGRCRHAVAGLLRLQSNDLRAIPDMVAACKFALDQFCQDVSPGGGRVHACLRSSLGKITQNSCVRMVNQTWSVEKQDVTYNPRVQAHCRKEMNSYCKGVEHGQQRVLICLKRHENSTGFSEACKEAVESVGAKATFMKTAFENPTGDLEYLSRSSRFWDRWGIMFIGATVFLVFLTCLAGGALLFRALRPRPTYGIEVEQGEAIDQEDAKGTVQPQAT